MGVYTFFFWSKIGCIYKITKLRNKRSGDRRENSEKNEKQSRGFCCCHVTRQQGFFVTTICILKILSDVWHPSVLLIACQLRETWFRTCQMVSRPRIMTKSREDYSSLCIPFKKSNTPKRQIPSLQHLVSQTFRTNFVS